MGCGDIKDKRQKKEKWKSSQLIFNEEISCRVEGNIMFHAMLKLFVVYYVYEFMCRKRAGKFYNPLLFSGFQNSSCSFSISLKRFNLSMLNEEKVIEI